MKKNLKINVGRVIGKVSKNIYGGFVEHLGRNVYGGIYDPNDPNADKDGFRTDTLAAIRELDMPVTRYPGGCFSSSWYWEDSVGKNRPTRVDPCWRQIEPNKFGLDEFIKWARKAKTEPMLTINVGQRNAIEAERMVEYCNFPKGTTLSDMRRANGAEEPHNVRYFCLGNEQYGTWEYGQSEPQVYAQRARECAKIIHALDPDAKFILCGSCDSMEWNRKVLDVCYDYVDYLSIHLGFYSLLPDDEYLDLLDKHTAFLEETALLCEKIRLEKKSTKKIKISVDEWILWDCTKVPRPGEVWTTGMHLLEQDYTLRDVLEVGGLFSVFHNHADSIEFACVAQSVNVIAPIRTERNGVLWKQGTFFPFYYASHYGRGTAMEIQGADKTLRTSAIWNEKKSEMALFLTNFEHNAVDLEFTADGMKFGKVAIEAVTLTSADEKAVNTPEKTPLMPQPLSDIALTDNTVMVSLPPRSWNCIRFSCNEM